MISEPTYHVLKNIPRTPQKTSLNDLHEICGIDVSLLSEILIDAESRNIIQFKHKDPYGGVRGNLQRNAAFFLTEAGQVAIEEYRYAEQSRKIADESLNVAKAAKRAAIASAVAAGAALLAQIPEIVEILRSFLPPAS